VGRWIGIGGGVEKGKGEGRREKGEEEVRVVKGMEIKSFSTHETFHPTPRFLEKKEPRLVALRTKTRIWRWGWYGMGIRMEDRDGRRRISKKTKKGSVEVGRGRERGS